MVPFGVSRTIVAYGLLVSLIVVKIRWPAVPVKVSRASCPGVVVTVTAAPSMTMLPLRSDAVLCTCAVMLPVALPWGAIWIVYVPVTGRMIRIALFVPPQLPYAREEPDGLYMVREQ